MLMRVPRGLAVLLAVGLISFSCSDETPSGKLDSTITQDLTQQEASPPDEAGADQAAPVEGGGGMTLTSGDITEGQPIDKKFTCDDADLSPALSWSGAPAGTKSFVLIMDDPDAPSGTFTHWVLYDTEAGVTSLTQGLAKDATVLGVAKQGKNSFGETGYRGPCPPQGNAHHYIFTLSALSDPLGLQADEPRDAVEQAMQGKVLGTAKLTGTYQR